MINMIGSTFVQKQKENIRIVPYSLDVGIVKDISSENYLLSHSEKWRCEGCQKLLYTSKDSPLSDQGPLKCFCGSKHFRYEGVGEVSDCQMYTIDAYETSNTYQVLLTKSGPDSIRKYDKVKITKASRHIKGKKEIVVAHQMTLMPDERSRDRSYNND